MPNRAAGIAEVEPSHDSTTYIFELSQSCPPLLAATTTCMARFCKHSCPSGWCQRTAVVDGSKVG